MPLISTSNSHTKGDRLLLLPVWKLDLVIIVSALLILCIAVLFEQWLRNNKVEKLLSAIQRVQAETARYDQDSQTRRVLFDSIRRVSLSEAIQLIDSSITKSSGKIIRLETVSESSFRIEAVFTVTDLYIWLEEANWQNSVFIDQIKLEKDNNKLFVRAQLRVKS